MDRIVEKDRTYRIPKADGSTDLLQVIEIGKTLKMKNIKTGKIKSMDKANFIKKLNEGTIYVSAMTKSQLKKRLTQAGIKIVKGNFVRKRDVELYLIDADWKEAIRKFKEKFQPFFKKLVSGLLATGIFFGSTIAKADEAEKQANKYADVIQELIDQRGADLKAEAHAVKSGNHFSMKIKITDQSPNDANKNKNVCVIDLTKTGNGTNSLVDAKLKTNNPMDDFDIFHEILCKEIYNSWSKQLLTKE